MSGEWGWFARRHLYPSKHYLPLHTEGTLHGLVNIISKYG
jgi:hypothetical protein